MGAAKKSYLIFLERRMSMKNKKRILSLLLGVIMLLAVLLNTVGCASDEEEETGEYTREISTADDGLRYDEKGYLMDTCLYAQDIVKKYLDYFKIPYDNKKSFK